MLFIIISLVVAVIVLLALWRLEWALAAVVVLLPTYTVRFSLGEVPFTLLEFGLIALAVVFFFRSRLYRLSFLKQAVDRVPFKIPLTIFLAAATVSVLVSPDWHAALGIWRAYFIEAAVFYFIFVNVVRTKETQQLILGALGISALTIAGYSIYQNFTGLGIPDPWQSAELRRVTAWYGYPAAVALYLAPIVGLFLGRLINRPKPRAWGWSVLVGAVIISGCLAVYFTHSRGAIVAILAAVAVLGLLPRTALTPRLRHVRLWRAVCFGLVIVCLAGLFLWPGVSDRFRQILAGADNSTNVRLVLWQGTLRLIADHWLSGTGLGGFPALYDQYRAARHTELLLYPHNIFLNFWVEIGFVGLLAFLWLWVSCWKKIWAALRRPGVDVAIVVGTLCALIVMIVHGLVDVPYFKNDLALLFWIIVGLATSNYEIANKKDVHGAVDVRHQMRYNDDSGRKIS